MKFQRCKDLCILVVAMALPGCRSHQEKNGGAGQLIATSEVDIESFGPNAPLQNVVGATRLADGTIVIADSYASSLRFFTSSGVPKKSIGRHGAGPGEFSAIASLSRCGDRIYVWDFMLNRMTVLDALGTVVRQYTPQIDVGSVACGPNGRLAVLVTAGHSTIVDGFPRDQAAVIELDSTGKQVAVLDTLPGWEQRVLGRAPLLTSTDSRIFVSSADDNRLRVYPWNSSARDTASIGMISARVPTTGNYEAALTTMVSRLPQQSEQDAMRKLARKTMPLPKRLPAVFNLQSDKDDVYAVLSAPGDSSTTLRRISVASAVRTYIVPRSLAIWDVVDGVVIGSYEDGNGEPHVAVYRLPN